MLRKLLIAGAIMAFLGVLISLSLSCDLFLGPKKESELVIENINSRIINNEIYLLTGRINNISSKPAKITKFRFIFYDAAGTELTQYNDYEIYITVSSDDDIKSTGNRDGDVRHYYNLLILPNSHGWFQLPLENYDNNINSYEYELEWEDGADNVTAIGENLVTNGDEVSLLPETLEWLEREVRVVGGTKIIGYGKAKIVNSSAFSVIPWGDWAILGFDEQNNLVQIFDFDHLAIFWRYTFLPKDAYCFRCCEKENGTYYGNMYRCMSSGQQVEVSFDAPLYFQRFLLEEISYWELKGNWIVPTNLSPVSGRTEFTAISQIDQEYRVCAELNRKRNKKEVFFWMCGNSFNFRGFNIAVMNASDGTIVDFMTFDTWFENDADDRMIDFIKTIPGGDIVMVAIADEGTRKLSDEASVSLLRIEVF